MTGKLSYVGALLVLVFVGYLVPMYVGSTQGEKDSLPGAYYKLLHEALLSRLKTGDFATHDPGAMLAAAVLFTQKHPDNSAYRQQQWLERALALGDLFAQHSEEDANPNKQDYEWDIHFWLDTYRLLRDQLGQAREQRWHRELEKISTWFAEHSAARADFPRYQGPYIRTSTNHLAIFASITYLAGKVLDKPEWVQLGARVLRRLALEEQTHDGYWGEFTDNGPATGYNYFTLTCVALYYEHSGDKDVLPALERAKDFHIHFTWPDGTPVETINGRNRYWPVNSWGHFAFSHWPEGRRYAAFLTKFFQPTNISSRDLGRLAQNTLYYHSGNVGVIPLEQPEFSYRMKRVPAGIFKRGPWIVCMSGLTDVPVESQFTLERQGHISIYHLSSGLIVTGAGSKHQPELATFLERRKDAPRFLPLNTALRSESDRWRLGLGYSTFFTECAVPFPRDKQLDIEIRYVETGRGRFAGADMNLQLCLKAGHMLETDQGVVQLGTNNYSVSWTNSPGWIRHRNWELKVPKGAQLRWPIFPFNPYRNGPETELNRAIGLLTIPLVLTDEDKTLRWRRGSFQLSLICTHP